MKRKSNVLSIICILNFLLLALTSSGQSTCVRASYIDTWSYATPQLYIFNGTQYARYDVKANKFEGVNDIAKGYPAVPFSNFDAGYIDTWSYATPQLYIFNGTQYARYDVKANKFEGVNDIAKGYPGVPFSKFDACYIDTWSYATPQLYIFNGTQYARYDVKANKYEGVNDISKGYPGVPFSKFDACYIDTWSYATPQLYIFNGSKYARYDVKANKFEGVNDISKGYPGVPFCN
ncbi:MAG TPA: hypothetical protein PLN13_04800 [Bacteroidia bacterium]|nr:hypothetical protein [Bacteroidia bacterium]HRH07879.1 hypothetical protein [Bacteroidia bacterium]